MGSCEGWTIITDSGFGFPLPDTLTPAYWLAPVSPSVHRAAFSTLQVRTDDYGRAAADLVLEGRHLGDTETDMHLRAERLRACVRRGAWLQRGDRASLELLPGSDIELKPDGKKSRVGILSVRVAARNQKWIGADGREVTG